MGCFYIFVTSYQREKLKNNPIYNCIKKNKILRYLTKEVKDLHIENCKTELPWQSSG